MTALSGCASTRDKPATTAPVQPVPAVAAAEAPHQTWPFRRWTRAEAIAFNQFQARAGVPLLVYDDKRGWSEHIAERKPLDAALAKEAYELVLATEGEVSISKCPFPRHAVVFYDGDVPVASINVCFACGDIMAWPLWQPEPDWSNITPEEERAYEQRTEKQDKLYKVAFPKWKTFFAERVGFAIDTWK